MPNKIKELQSDARDLRQEIEKNQKYRAITNLLISILGALIFSLGVNLFVVPSGIYNGGALGLSQLLTSFVKHNAPGLLFPKFTSVIYYLINVPLFVLAYKGFGAGYLFRNVLCVTIETLAMMLIPVPREMLVDNVLTSTLIGGLVAGCGSGLIFRSGSSAGGVDIVGMYMTKKYKNISVGRLSMSVNAVIYLICALTQNVAVAIYSIIYSVTSSMTVDKIHEQNIMTEMTILTKKKPDKIIKYITSELGHSCNYWKATSGYTGEPAYIIYTVVSKYDARKLDAFLMAYDAKVFAVKNNDVGLDGNFRKKL